MEDYQNNYAFMPRIDNVKYKFAGSFLIQGQFHFTMENQTCLCVPTEDGIDMYPSSQWITVIQQNASAALNIPFNRCVLWFGLL